MLIQPLRIKGRLWRFWLLCLVEEVWKRIYKSQIWEICLIQEQIIRNTPYHTLIKFICSFNTKSFRNISKRKSKFRSFRSSHIRLSKYWLWNYREIFKENWKSRYRWTVTKKYVSWTSYFKRMRKSILRLSWCSHTKNCWIWCSTSSF